MLLELAVADATSTVTAASGPSDLLTNLLVFIMATFLGTALIRQVSKLLHTHESPLLMVAVGPRR